MTKQHAVMNTAAREREAADQLRREQEDITAQAKQDEYDAALKAAAKAERRKLE